ncbi:fimbrial protein [Salmonella enterica subsp. enterica serovar Hull]|uniref:Fimbrial protein n=1 Tax=Salmonella enterica subsp. enterica serovar Hull TaxID=1403564 RepID=A0A5X4PM11_SALET|nr:fimbrial protein [Salmonella enterica subsp. enterica serovar Putten]EBZ7588773.1 fimbrial protein [Salmonella enterica subsp. enterica serovar Hull]EBZ8651199.1 fimbrial protein [Salmonella enterica subsp. enterica serovar Hull]EEB7450871.1 fimbrial protein [Salmonella enterica subsp. enterica serovar Emek]
MKRSFKQVVLGLSMVLLSYSGRIVAEDIPVTIKVTILEPVCTVTDLAGNNRTEVDFETVSVTAVNNTAAIRDLNMKVTCDGVAPSGKTLKIQVSAVSGGTITYAGQQVLGTSLSGLGIRLTDTTGQVIPPGLWTALSGVIIPSGSLSAQVKLKAALVSDTVNTLKGGSFTSSASVVMAYQ